MADPIRVVVVDDQPLVRSGLIALLSAFADIEVVGEAGDGAAAHEAARAHAPDVVLMDIRMPGIDGIEATRRIVADPTLDDVRVIVLTTFDLDEYVADALRHGASGFLLKHVEPEQLVHAVRVVAAGQALLAPEVTKRLLARLADPTAGQPADPAKADLLTAREREVVALVADGLSNDEIAAQWVVSPATVRTHVSRAMAKLHARDRAQLVVIAYRHGLASGPRHI